VSITTSPPPLSIPVVVTTIQAPTEPVREFASLPGCHLVACGDQKTPHDFDVPNCSYLSPTMQEELFPVLSSALPWNHYVRKNLGYAYAIRSNPEAIAESDDDNSPVDEWPTSFINVSFSKTAIGPPIANPFLHFTKDYVWPRGLPLDAVKGAGLDLVDRESPNVLVIQSMVDGDPDVDAIFRLTATSNPRFEANEPIALDSHVYAPFNSQATIWKQGSFELMYLPSTVTFRFTDILRSWVAQRILWEQGASVGYVGSGLFSRRNIHSLMDDFESEIPCYLHSKPAIEALEDLDFSERTVGGQLLEAYRSLATANVVRNEEIQVVEKWIDTIS
jgi:hypothetical protein